MKSKRSIGRPLAATAGLLLVAGLLAACGAKEEKQANADQNPPAPSASAAPAQTGDEMAVAKTRELISLVKAGKDEEAVTLCNGAYDINQNDQQVLSSRITSAKFVIKQLREIELDQIQVDGTPTHTYSHLIKVNFKAPWKKGIGKGIQEDYTMWRLNKQGIPYMEFAG
jgi:hypothetical protein